MFGSVKADTQELAAAKEGTKVILVYSPVGGSGKTALSLGISGIISKYRKKVLYISTETLQSFRWMLKCDGYLSRSFERSLINKDFDIVDKFRSCVKTGIFSYLPPVQQAVPIAGISLDSYIHLINKIKEAKLYDYVVIDSSSELDTGKCLLMNAADKVVIVANQDEMAVMKIDALLDNIDCSDNNKFLFICNKYRKTEENHLMDNTMKNRCIVKQYVGYMDPDSFTLDRIMENEELQNFVYGII